MLNRKYYVQIGDKRYSSDFQTGNDSKSKWQGVLERAYGKTDASCCCPGRGPRKLAIKHRASSGEYHLARFAGTGAEHANECRFYAPAPESSGMQGYSRGVVEEGEDGLLRIRLARGLQAAPPKDSGDEVIVALPTAPGVRKPAMSLLGLLHLLWQEARLNVWYPAMLGKRNLGVVTSVLYKAATRVGSGRVRLADVLLMSADKDSKAATANQERVTQAIGRNQRVIAVAPLAQYSADKHGGDVARLPLSKPFGIPQLYLQKTQWDGLQKSFQQELSFWMRGGTVIAIAQVDVKQGQKWPQARVLDVALMPVSDQWIPFDSSYESMIEARLREEGRAFEKPLRFDAGEEEVFPDFWLLDVGKPYPMEVFGMATPEYLIRKQIKLVHYNREYGVDGWWSWSADNDTKGLQIPSFPVKQQAAK